MNWNKDIQVLNLFGSCKEVLNPQKTGGVNPSTPKSDWYLISL